MLEKTEIAGLCKDTTTHAVINTDNAALNAYKAKKLQLKKMNSMETRILTLEKELQELKTLVSEKLLANQ